MSLKLRMLFANAEICGGDVEVKGITSDSRQIAPGYIFAAIKGEVLDGRKFIPMAIEAGAVAVLSEGLEGSIPITSVTVENVRQSLSLAARQFHPDQPPHMVAITGTNGKSSCVDFLRQIWAKLGKHAASLGTLGTQSSDGFFEDLKHTTADPVALHKSLQALASKGITHAAMEASSHGLAQHRLDGLALSAAAFTNLTQDHLDYHKDFDDYRRAKQRLFSDLLPSKAPAIINADSPYASSFEEVAEAAGQEVFSVGWRGHDLRIDELTPRPDGQFLRLKYQNKTYETHLPLIGEFQALNALTAAALAISLGDEAEKILDSLAHLKPVLGRMDFIGEKPGGGVVFVDYAHTPDGLETALRAARPHTLGALHVVFGCGGDRDKSKRPLMGAVASEFADKVIITDDNPRSENAEDIRAAILHAVPGAMEIGDRKSAIEAAIAKLGERDVLLIAGKGHEQGQIIGDEVIAFSDHEVARAALQALEAC